MVIRSMPLVMRGENIECRHNSMGEYTIYDTLGCCTGCLVLGVVNIIFSGLGQAEGRERGQPFSNDQNNTLSM